MTCFGNVVSFDKLIGIAMLVGFGEKRCRKNLPLVNLRLTTSSPILKQFDYRPNKWQSVLLFGLALAGATLLTFFAFTLNRPVNVVGIQLTPEQGRMLLGAFSAFSPIGLFCLGAMVYVAFSYDRRVALTDTHLILPKPTRMGLSRDEIHIPLESISLVGVRDFIGTAKLLRIDHSNGVVNIPSNMFRNITIFHEMCQTIEDAVNDRATYS